MYGAVCLINSFSCRGQSVFDCSSHPCRPSHRLHIEGLVHTSRTPAPPCGIWLFLLRADVSGLVPACQPRKWVGNPPPSPRAVCSNDPVSRIDFQLLPSRPMLASTSSCSTPGFHISPLPRRQKFFLARLRPVQVPSTKYVHVLLANNPKDFLPSPVGSPENGEQRRTLSEL